MYCWQRLRRLRVTGRAVATTSLAAIPAVAAASPAVAAVAALAPAAVATNASSADRLPDQRRLGAEWRHK